MITFSVLKFYRKLVKNARFRAYSSQPVDKPKLDIEKIRNIGILAHIDAGKTTTTERMLFYSGTIRSMGEVHHGNTVTDYMEQERQRGITITSAAVSFPWRESQINLIDTPGHIDFTMEVEQSLAVLDGAVVVLDASAGVEAQTLTVWHQAEGYKVPRLIYLNKMDRSDADVNTCLRSIEDKLHTTPVLLHTPVRYNGSLIGLIDLVKLEEVIWTQGRGQKYTRRKLTEKEDGDAWASAMDSRRHIVDTLSSMDDDLANTVIEHDSLDDLDSEHINKALRNCTVQSKIFPILCGSSYKNIGVQSLMDAVIDYLPSPLQCNELYSVFGTDLAARVFKVQHDDQKGVLTFMRLYGGDVTKGQKIYNLGQNRSESSALLYVALADEYKLVDNVTAGNIAVVSGLKETRSGDLITSSQSAANRAKTALAGIIKDPTKIEKLALPSAKQRLQTAEEEMSSSEIAEIMLGIGSQVPEPVFLCSVEPPSASWLPALETALAELAREDPSLRVSHDEDAGQIVLAGMGELHLEIIKERIIREYKIAVELGPLQIAYREALTGGGRHTLAVDRKIGNARQVVTVTASAKHYPGVAEDKVLKLDMSQESAPNLSQLRPRQLTAVRHGVATALSHGPIMGCKMVDVQVTLHWLEVGRGTSDSSITAAVAQCLRKVFENAECRLLEPVMSVEVVCPDSHSARVIADLARRRADVTSVDYRHGSKVISCLVPLSELLGYSTTLRSLSSGLASFTMHLHSRRLMTADEQNKAVEGCAA